MATRKRSARLPSGKYAWRGRAVAFSKLPKKERARLRSSWATKAAKTVRKERRRARAEIIVTRSSVDSWQGKKAPSIFAADVTGEHSLKQVIRQVVEAKREEAPETKRGAWVATIEWPEDERSQEGRPFRTEVSIPIASTDGDSAHDLEAYLEDIEESPWQLDRQKSGAKGEANVVAVTWITF